MQLNYCHCIKFVGFIQFLEQTPIIFLSRINQLFFVMGKKHITLGIGIIFLNSVKWLNS